MLPGRQRNNKSGVGAPPTHLHHRQPASPQKHGHFTSLGPDGPDVSMKQQMAKLWNWLGPGPFSEPGWTDVSLQSITASNITPQRPSPQTHTCTRTHPGTGAGWPSFHPLPKLPYIRTPQVPNKLHYGTSQAWKEICSRRLWSQLQPMDKTRRKTVSQKPLSCLYSYKAIIMKLALSVRL